MQTFKEIPFQNYIELRFNNKNVHELAQQEALVKYKRNAQLLAEIFTFEPKKRQHFKTQDCISPEQLEQMAIEIKKQEEVNEKKIEQVENQSRIYENLMSCIKDIKTKEELFNMIDQLKSNGLYDECHPYFVENSPFYLSTTEQNYLQVTKSDEMREEGLSFYELN